MTAKAPLDRAGDALVGIEALLVTLVDWLGRYGEQGGATPPLPAPVVKRQDGRPALTEVAIHPEMRSREWVTRWSLFWREPSDDGLEPGKRKKELMWFVSLEERGAGNLHLNIRRVYANQVSDWRIDVSGLDVEA